MAQAICQALLRAHFVPRSHLSFLRRDRLKMKEDEQRFKITATSAGTLVAGSEVIILGFRPQQAQAAFAEIASCGSLDGKWVISMLAGVPIQRLRAALGPGPEIARVMPNLAVAVNEGMTIVSMDAKASAEFRSYTRSFFGSLGVVSELPEDKMDIACGMAGSGPGFVFRLIEAMAQCGQSHGIPVVEARKIAAQTFLGAAELISKGAVPAELIAQIGTPHGTTQAGFDAMNRLEVDRHFRAVIEAAAQRSRELNELGR